MKKENLVKKINIFLLILSIIIFFLSMFQDKNIEALLRGISFGINMYIFIISLVLVKKSNKVILIISLLLTLFFGFGTISSTISNVKRNNYLNSEEFYVEEAKSLERSLSDSAQYYYDLEYYIENLDLEKIIITKEQAEENFEENWFRLKQDKLGICDGYIVINIDQNNIKNIIESYKKRINSQQYIPDSVVSLYYDEVMSSLNIDVFVSCNGAYSYTTDGFDNTNLSD